MSLWSIILIPLISFLTIITIFALKTLIYNLYLNRKGLWRIPNPFPSRNIFRLLFLTDPSITSELLNSIPKSIKLIALQGPFYIKNVFVLSPESIRELTVNTTKDYDKPNVAKMFLHSFTGPSSIFTADEKTHIRLKNAMRPALKFDNLINMKRIFIREGCEVADRLYKQGGHIEVVKCVRKCTFQIIMDFCFGNHFIEEKECNDLFDLYHKSLSSPKGFFFIITIVRIFAPFIPISWLSSSERCKVKLRKRVRKVCEKLVNESEAEPQLHSDTSLLATMIRAKNESKISVEELNQTVLSFLLAGQATTTIVISWTLQILSKYERVQQKLYNELLSLPDNSCDEYVNKLDALPYLNSVIKEVIRLYPPIIYILRRVCNRDGVYLNNYFIPYDTSVRVPILALQTNKQVWGQDALDFRPERFMEPVSSDMKWMNCAFWFGSHGCVGQRFAMLEIKAVVSQVVLKYLVNESNNSPHVRRHGTDSTPKGLKLKLEKRPSHTI